MPTCVVPGCTSGYASNPEKRHFFVIPKDPVLAARWKAAIKRSDLAVTRGRAVCQNHFRNEDILWQRELLAPDGRVLGVSQYKIPRLREGSVPTQFPWTDPTEITGSSSAEPHNDVADIIQNPQKEQDQLLDGSSSAKPHNDLVDIIQNPQNEQDQLLDGSSSAKPHNDVADVAHVTQNTQTEQLQLHCTSELCHGESTTPEQNEPGTGLSPDPKRRKLSSSEHEKNENLSGQLPLVSQSLVTFCELSAAKISLPPGWIIEKNRAYGSDVIIIFTNKIVKVNETFTPFVLKALVVKNDCSIEISVLGRPFNLDECLGNVSRCIKSTKELEDLLIIVNDLNVCSGCTGPSVETEISQLKCKTIKKDCTGFWRHDSCRLLLKKVTICKFCQTAKKSLVTKLRRWKSSQVTKRAPIGATSPRQKKRWLQLQSKYRSVVREKKKAIEKIKKMKTELRLCREKMAYLSNFDLEEQITNGNLSENEAQVVKQILDAAKHKNSKGRNYSEAWMMLCMLLHMRSPCGYDFLRNNDILPLPCVRTIRRYLSKMKTSCGFDEQFFKVLKLAFEKKSEKQRHGILLFDEMSTRESVSVDSKNLTYKGLIDFGNEGPRSSDFSEKANHGLVLMFQPVDDTYTQPIAVFASRGPVKGTVLAQLIIKAIVLLEDAGAKIHAVVGDGASTNRKFWSEVGVCGTKKNFRNYFDHPTVEGRKIFAFSDTPHLIKTIRNRLHNNRIIRMDPAESEIKWEYLEQLEKRDRALAGPGQVLMCPKLTHRHVYLQNAMKMRVRLATQVFSNSVAGGLRFFQKRVPEFADSEATAAFCKWMNDLFDALNRKHPIDGVQPGNKDFVVIEDSLRKLNAWEENVETKKLSKEMFLTSQTAEGLRVTLQSTLDLVQYLTEHCGFSCVLTGRINQDPLEKFFGTVRQAGGCNDHPATPTFLHIYKILSTFSVLKPPKTGNCSITADKSPVPLISLSELKAIYNNTNPSIDRSVSVRSIKTRLEQIVKHNNNWQLQEFMEHDYYMPAVADCALYCLTADLTKRILNTVKCVDCKEALIRPEAEGLILPEAELAHWQERALIIHPNKHLYNFVVFLENKFEKHCRSANVFEEILSEVFEYDRLSFPCSAHATDVIFSIIQYFVSMRMQQYCTRINADQRKINQLKKKTSKFCRT